VVLSLAIPAPCASSTRDHSISGGNSFWSNGQSVPETLARCFFRALAFIAIAELLWQNSFLWVFWSPHLAGKVGGLRQLNMFAVVVYWPLLYLLAMGMTRRVPAIALTK
jgi:hypothetical protein